MQRAKGSMHQEGPSSLVSSLCPSTQPGGPVLSQRLESGPVKVSAIQMWQASVLIWHDNSPKWNCPKQARFTQLMALPLILGNFSLLGVWEISPLGLFQVSSFKMDWISVGYQLSTWWMPLLCDMSKVLRSPTRQLIHLWKWYLMLVWGI